MRYKVSFEFESDEACGNPALWAWGNLAQSFADDHTKIDWNTLAIYRHTWEEMTDDD